MDTEDKIEVQARADQQTRRDESTLDTRTQAPVVAGKDNSNLKLTIVIVAAVLVALGLIGGAYMAFIKESEQITEGTGNSSQTETTEPIEVPDQIDGTAIDQEVTEIDAIVNELDNDVDFPEDELNDKNLGL